MTTIGVITTSYPRFAGDPAGNFVAAHVAAIRALGHRVEVIAADPVRTSDFGLHSSSGFEHASPASGTARSPKPEARSPVVTRIPSSLFYSGGAPDRFEQSPLAAAAAAAYFAPRFVAAIRAAAHRWDGAIAHWLAPSALAALVATPRDLPLLAIAHGGDVHLLDRLHLLRPTLGALARRPNTRIAFVSRALRALAGDPPNSFVQSMGVDVAHFAALPHAPTSPPTIAVLARLVPIKGVDRAIAAFRALPRHLADARLVIAGDGPERAALAALAARDPRITFVGSLAAPARDALLSRTSVVVVPSRALPNRRTEGTPLVALEALAAGLPVVADPVGGLADLPTLPLAALPAALALPRRPPPAALPDWRAIAPSLLPDCV